MSDNVRESTTEELKTQLEEARKVYESLQKTVKQRESEEKERREAELALAKDTRLKEIKQKEHELRDLYKAYIRDYGELQMEYIYDNYDWWPMINKTLGWF